MKTVTIYSKGYCPYCKSAKDLFEAMEVPYEEVNVEDPDKQTEFMELTQKHGHRTVPMIFIGDEFVGGFDHVMELQKRGELQQMLED